MQTAIVREFLDTPQGQEANSILRACVHCGFCTATCPTYHLLGNELDSPRGRIYLIKQVLEGQPVSASTQLHLDRCLTCRSCETTCPSGVRYGRLADIGRSLVDAKVPRPWHQRLVRLALRRVIPYPRRFSALLRLGHLVRPLLPEALRRRVPPRRPVPAWPNRGQERVMLVLEGCAQQAATPNTNAAAARVLDRLGIRLLREPRAGCCGAVSYHLSAHEEGLDFMRRNIDAWWPHIEGGAEAIVITASGCGALVKEYGDALRHDPAYAEKAARVAAMSKDVVEILADADSGPLEGTGRGRRIAFHSPCTLQHGQQLAGTVETVLGRAGFALTAVPDAHLCCGSAGTYSILQPGLSQRLLHDKIAALQGETPEAIATANVGCQLHLETLATVPVRHWIELLDEAVAQSR